MENQTGSQASLEPLGSKELSIYLQHHLAGSKTGVDLFTRVSKNHPDHKVRQTVEGLVPQIENERDFLMELMNKLDISYPVFQEGVAFIGEKLGRLKLNGEVVSRSPLSDLLEIEALTDAVYAKRQGWQVLKTYGEEDSRIDTDLIQELIFRANRQIDQLTALHHRTSERFLKNNIN